MPGSSGALLGLILLAAAALACSDPEPGSSIPPCTAVDWDGRARRPDVVLVVADTLRRNHLGLHGGAARTPRYDRFARKHLYFEHAASQSPWTKPSMATLFTGLYPSQHRVLSHPGMREAGRETLRVDALSEELTTLGELFEQAGYQTAAFVANPWLERGFGFAQGFDVYDDSFAANHTPGARVNAAALDWLEEREGDAPYLLYLHYMDPHAPYPPIPRKRLRERLDALRSAPSDLGYAEQREVARRAKLPTGRSAIELDVRPTRALLRLAYDMGVEQLDTAFGTFLDALEERGEDPGIVLTSDHGEALFARGWRGHGYGLFGDELDVPLALDLPGIAHQGAVDCPVGLVDVMASLCRYLGIECPEHSFGVPFLRRDDGTSSPEAHRLLVSEGVKRKPEHRALRSRRYKLLWEPSGRPGSEAASEEGYSLFELDEDPRERHDLLDRDALAPEHRRAFRTLRRALPQAVPRFEGPGPETVPMDEETAERLRALGYLD